MWAACVKFNGPAQLSRFISSDCGSGGWGTAADRTPLFYGFICRTDRFDDGQHIREGEKRLSIGMSQSACDSNENERGKLIENLC